jgi:KRAB domain-containing zinc finger protein
MHNLFFSADLNNSWYVIMEPEDSNVFPPTPPATPPSSTTATDNYFCDLCDKKYSSRSKLAEHMRYRHSTARPHGCSQCPKVFKSASNLRQHIKCAHERPRFPCSECPPQSKVYSESGLRYHRLTSHGDSSRPRPQHTCSICAKTFVQATLLRKHVGSAHVGERRFTCPYCPAAFKRKDHADRHVTDTHSLVGELFECEDCGGRFQSASRLKQHAKLHHDESVRRPCDLCGKRMLAKNLVTHHQRAHGRKSAKNNVLEFGDGLRDSLVLSDFVRSLMASQE